MNTYGHAPILEIWRGNIVESVHFGSIAVVRADGTLLASWGDPRCVTYLRSSAKPFQALPFVEQGGPERYQLEPKEIALICASHHGTDEHAATAASIQAKTGSCEEELLCGVHALSHQPTIEAMRARGEKLTPNRHNCSGKHSGMLAFTRLKGLSPADRPYIDPGHPIQQEILAAFASMCSLPKEHVVIGIDGCSAPNFAIPLENAALGLARLVDPAGLPPQRAAACRTISAAMTAHPFMVGGPDSFDTRLMELASGRVLAKGGAEGYQALAVFPEALGEGSRGIGIALKISDGDLGGHGRTSSGGLLTARPAVAIEILRQLGVLREAELDALAELGPEFEIYNYRRLHTGQARPVFQLNRGAVQD